MNWYIKVLKDYVEFDGRARRKEFWYFVLFHYIFTGVLWLIGMLVEPYYVFSLIYYLGTLLPYIGVSIRRLHDTGRSGWWLFIGLVPLAGPIILLVYMVSDSQPGANKYGPSPKLDLEEAGQQKLEEPGK